MDTFDRNFQFQVEHVSIAKKADVVMIAPASANVIGKLAQWPCGRYAHNHYGNGLQVSRRFLHRP
ncbi:MAG: flavoprotein [Blautia faecis]